MGRGGERPVRGYQKSLKRKKKKTVEIRAFLTRKKMVRGRKTQVRKKNGMGRAMGGGHV